MTKTNKAIIGILTTAIILIGIGYATITNTILKIEDTLEAKANQADFRVVFTNDIIVDVNSKGTVTAIKTDDTNAVFSVKGLKEEGDTATATYTIQNASKDIIAKDIKAFVIKGSNEYFFTTISNMSDTKLAPGETATFTVTTKLIKTPFTQQILNIGVIISASPEVENKHNGHNNHRK